MNQKSVTSVAMAGLVGSLLLLAASCTEPVSSTALAHGISEASLQFELIDGSADGLVLGQLRLRKGRADVRLEGGEYFRLNGQRLVRSSAWHIERLEARVPAADEYVLEFFDGGDVSRATISGLPRFELSDVGLARDENEQWILRGTPSPSPNRLDFSQRVELTQRLGDAGKVHVATTTRASAGGFQLELPDRGTASGGQEFVPGEALVTVTRTLNIAGFQMSGFSSSRATVRIIREMPVAISDMTGAVTFKDQNQ